MHKGATGKLVHQAEHGTIGSGEAIGEEFGEEVQAIHQTPATVTGDYAGLDGWNYGWNYGSRVENGSSGERKAQGKN